MLINHSFKVNLNRGHQFIPPFKNCPSAEQSLSCRTSLGFDLVINVLPDLNKIGQVVSNLMLDDFLMLNRPINWMLPATKDSKVIFAHLQPRLKDLLQQKIYQLNTYNTNEYVVGSQEKGFKLIDPQKNFSSYNIMQESGMLSLPNCNNYFPQIENAGKDSYEKRILDAGGIDTLLLPTEVNGCIAFFEPRPAWQTTYAKSATVDLFKVTEEARNFNAHLMQAGEENVSDCVISAGPGTLFGVGALSPPRQIILFIDQPEKAEALFWGLTKKISAQYPISFIQEYTTKPKTKLIIFFTYAAAERFSEFNTSSITSPIFKSVLTDKIMSYERIWESQLNKYIKKPISYAALPFEQQKSEVEKIFEGHHPQIMTEPFVVRANARESLIHRNEPVPVGQDWKPINFDKKTQASIKILYLVFKEALTTLEEIMQLNFGLPILKLTLYGSAWNGRSDDKSDVDVIPSALFFDNSKLIYNSKEEDWSAPEAPGLICRLLSKKLMLLNLKVDIHTNCWPAPFGDPFAEMTFSRPYQDFYVLPSVKTEEIRKALQQKLENSHLGRS